MGRPAINKKDKRVAIHLAQMLDPKTLKKLGGIDKARAKMKEWIIEGLKNGGYEL